MSHFSKSELIRALSEVEYGIIVYRILEDQCDAHQAVAEVDLLEKRQIRIMLTTRGYEELRQIEDDHEPWPIYETLEDLLWNLSPLYRERHQEEIMARLAPYSQEHILS